jgi:hypothetical protein
LALTVTMLATAASAQTEESPNPVCRHSRSSAACREARWAVRGARDGVPAIEAVAAERVQQLRAGFWDDFGRELPIVVIERRHGDGPRVTVMGGNAAGSAPRSISIPIPLARWDELVGEARDFDRAYVLEPKPPDRLFICTHPKSAVVESANIRISRLREGVFRKSSDECEAGPAYRLASKLAAAAVALLPGCAELDRGRGDSPPHDLATCIRFEGDRPAAALAFNRSTALSSASSRAYGPSVLRNYFHEDVRIVWTQSLDLRGIDAVAQGWPIKSGASHLLVFDRAIGETADRVKIFGRIEVSDGDSLSSATTEQLWERVNDDEFRLRAMQIGPLIPD